MDRRSFDVETDLDTDTQVAGIAMRAVLVSREEDSMAVVALEVRNDVVVGRDPEAAISTDSTAVSRRHASFSFDGRLVFVVDLGSRNGTLVNGDRVGRTPRLVQPGDVVSIGPLRVIVAMSGSPTNGATRPPPRTVSQSSLVVVDPAMVKLHAGIGRLAASDATILVTGETGTGKEIFAEQIHRASRRQAGPLVQLNCAAVPTTLLESELFGHERGAFTGAVQSRKGYFELANRGTLFLDEVGDMPLELQAKLLRVLEQQRMSRVGGGAEIDLDLRIVCATHRDLRRAIGEGRFREDLYYRISTVVLELPPLRDRPSEILPLAKTFIDRVAEAMGVPAPSLDEAASQSLLAHSWPGNLRELRNAMEHAVILCETSAIGTPHLPSTLVPSRAAAPESVVDPNAGMRERLDAIELESIRTALLAEGGNQTRAAKRLGISRRALVYKIGKYGLRD